MKFSCHDPGFAAGKLLCLGSPVPTGAQWGEFSSLGLQPTQNDFAFEITSKSLHNGCLEISLKPWICQ